MSTVLLVAGTVVSAIATLRQGQVMSAAEQYNALVAASQAQAYRTIGTFESEALKKSSAFEEARLRTAKQKAISTQRAIYAKSGVDIGEGSPLEVEAETAAEYELDIAANRYNTAIGLEKIRYETDVGVSRAVSEAAYRRMMAKQYQTSSYIGMGGTLLTGGYKLATLKGWT